MLPSEIRNCCHNCEYLRVDNFCLVKGKYVLSRNTSKIRSCQNFSSKNILSENELFEKKNHSKQLKKIMIEINSDKENSERLD